ncbi:Ig-like domain-containing protein [Gottfriedia sp. OAE603]|uniref:Ig-like domain-containing protein n=1 Tax=Gottfriedia sp. OAE603 TaxID=2663872 RepID=UPI00178C018D
MFKKWTNAVCSFLLAITFFMPFFTNVVAHAEEVNLVEDRLTLSENEIAITPGESKEITLTYINDLGEKEDVTKSPELKVENNDELVKFENGLITAGEDFGTTELQFSYKDFIVLLTINVEDTVELEKIKIDLQEFKLAVGKTLPLKVYGYYSDGSKEVIKDNLTWQSSNTSVATVKDGIVTALKEGKSNVIITVSYAEFSAKSEGKVFVQSPVKIKNIIANPSKLKLQQGDKQSITIFAVYTDGTKKDITKDVKYKIGNTKIVTFSDGKIVAKGKGATSIKASYQNFSANITVVVEKKKKHDDDDKKHDDDNHHKGKHGK